MVVDLNCVHFLFLKHSVEGYCNISLHILVLWKLLIMHHYILTTARIDFTTILLPQYFFNTHSQLDMNHYNSQYKFEYILLQQVNKLSYKYVFKAWFCFILLWKGILKNSNFLTCGSKCRPILVHVECPYCLLVFLLSTIANSMLILLYI